jgi:hypothetical protein
MVPSSKLPLHLVTIVSSALLLPFYAQAQTYLSFAPGIYNTGGTLRQKITADVELGRQWDVFSLGVDIGKTNLGRTEGRDTTAYMELRPNLNVFQQGIFTNTFTAGIGFVFNAKQNLMTEFTSGIEITPGKRMSYNIYFGQYYFSGRDGMNSVTFFGLSAAFYFKQIRTTGLLNPTSK